MAALRKFDLGHRIAPPRFLAFILLSLAAFAIALPPADWARAALVGFDAGAITFLLSCLPLFGHEAEDMRQAARRNDANRVMLLAITTIVCSVVLVAIGVELSQGAQPKAADIALIIGTLLLAWDHLPR